MRAVTAIRVPTEDAPELTVEASATPAFPLENECFSAQAWATENSA